MPYSILTVCTGNIFRSPAAQYLLARDLGEGAGVEVTSAGTAAVTDHPVAETMDTLLRREEIDAGEHRARDLTWLLVRESDVVIGMTRAHRDRAIALWPDAHARCFTLNELARLARGVTQAELEARAAELDERVAGPEERAAGPGLDARFAALVELAGARRGPGSRDDDIIDPVGEGPEVLRAVFKEIVESVDTIARVVRGTRRRRSRATPGTRTTTD